MEIVENNCSLVSGLEECERVIASGLEKFTEVAAALVTIRERGLYLATHDTFDAYCRERWAMSARRTYQLIAAKGVCDSLVLAHLPAPANECVARVLSTLPRDEAKRIWLSAVNYFNGRVTAAGLKQLLNGEKAGQFNPIDTFSAECPNCNHRFIPIVAEKSSRGPMWPAKSVKWALGLVTGESAADYGCGKFRNSPLIATKFARVVCVDTQTQVDRVARYKPQTLELQSVAGFDASGGVDVLFLIAVLHIVPSDTRKKIASRCKAKARQIVVEVPMALAHYRKKALTEFDDGWLMSGNTFYKNISQEEIDTLFHPMKRTHKMRDNQHVAAIYEWPNPE